MARKNKKHEEHENHERWLVSYADFITLLFAFFVVMYSLSSVNEGKYRVLSDSLVAAFRSSSRSLVPVQVGDLARSPVTPLSEQLLDRPIPSLMSPILIDMPATVLTEIVQLEELMDQPEMGGSGGIVEAMASAIERSIAPLIEQGLVEVRRNQFYLEIELKSAFLFTSGSASFSVDAQTILGLIAEVLATQPNRIHIEGYTDNIPVTSEVYPSNWELAAARASAVTRLFASKGVAPDRMAAISYGENKPAADNDSEAGRARNRRVVVVVLNELTENTGLSETAAYSVMESLLKLSPFWVD